MRYIEYPWVMFKELLNGVRLQDDQRTSVAVVHLTTSGAKDQVVEMLDENPGNTPDLYKVIDDHIYANWKGYLYKWTGNKFEKATEQEQRRYDEVKQITSDDVERYPGGWSQREFGESSTDYHFSVEVGRNFSLDITNKLLDEGGHSLVSVDVQRSGQASQSVWHLDGRPRRVSSREYRNAFESPK